MFLLCPFSSSFTRLCRSAPLLLEHTTLITTLRSFHGLVLCLKCSFPEFCRTGAYSSFRYHLKCQLSKGPSGKLPPCFKYPSHSLIILFSFHSKNYLIFFYLFNIFFCLKKANSVTRSIFSALFIAACIGLGMKYRVVSKWKHRQIHVILHVLHDKIILTVFPTVM